MLDGRPRYPDVEGVATAITTRRITIDHRHSYEVSRDFLSFSTYTLKLEPMLGRVGQYVQLGLSGDRVVWMAGVGAVVQTARPEVIYTGTFLRQQGDRLVFRDGTVLRVAPSLVPPPSGTFVEVAIDAATHRVVRVTAA